MAFVRVDRDSPRVVTAAYTVIGGDEELPLGEEFQDHLKRFLRPGEKNTKKRLELVKKLVEQTVYVSSFTDLVSSYAILILLLLDARHVCNDTVEGFPALQQHTNIEVRYINFVCKQRV